jgi:hypothetical protein
MNRGHAGLALLCSQLALAACAVPPVMPAAPRVSLPLRLAWYEGREVRYVTTDASDPAVAADQGVNFAPRLAAAISAAPGQSLTERVYKVANFPQRTIFQSVPGPAGSKSADTGYSPLWRMVFVTWRKPAEATELRSEEAVLAAEDEGKVTLQVTRIVLNCPILSVSAVGR